MVRQTKASKLRAGRFDAMPPATEGAAPPPLPPLRTSDADLAQSLAASRIAKRASSSPGRTLLQRALSSEEPEKVMPAKVKGRSKFFKFMLGKN